MRSPKFFSVATLAPNKQIVVVTEPIEKTFLGKLPFFKVPFLRGALALLDGMALGVRAMRFAANIQMAPELQPVPEHDPAASPEEAKEVQAHDEELKRQEAMRQKKVMDAAIMGTLIVSVVLALVIFKGVPNVISASIAPALYGKNPPDWQVSLTTEIIKITLFLGYVYAISFMPEIRRVFQFHGAEHKAINVLEAGEELTMENCRKQTRLHPRCGTSFMVIVLIIGLITFTFMPRPHGLNPFVLGLVRFLMEIPVLFFVGGVSYELLRLAGKNRNKKVVMAMFAPGLATQYLTTREPDDQQIEVALVSLKQCMDAQTGGKVAELPLTLDSALPKGVV